MDINKAINKLDKNVELGKESELLIKRYYEIESKINTFESRLNSNSDSIFKIVYNNGYADIPLDVIIDTKHAMKCIKEIIKRELEIANQTMKELEEEIIKKLGE
jgi:hypothetical protein